MASQKLQFPGLAVRLIQYSEVVDRCVVPYLFLHASIPVSSQCRIFSLVVRGLTRIRYM